MKLKKRDSHEERNSPKVSSVGNMEDKVQEKENRREKGEPEKTVSISSVQADPSEKKSQTSPDPDDDDDDDDDDDHHPDKDDHYQYHGNDHNDDDDNAAAAVAVADDDDEDDDEDEDEDEDDDDDDEDEDEDDEAALPDTGDQLSLTAASQPGNSQVQSGGTMTAGNAIDLLQRSLESCPDAEAEAADPEGIKVSLLPHQRRALPWLLWRENNYPCGGILADGIGLGKTLTMIALILDSKIKAKKDVKKEKKPEVSRVDSSLVVSKGTLIICPAFLLDHWKRELKPYVKKGSLEVYVYHGPNREKSARVLAGYDVVVTTYGVVWREIPVQKDDAGKDAPVPSCSTPLLEVTWARVVLDEAHKIKNPKTKTSKAVCQLRAGARWAVTGTPIQNNLLDMYSLLKFLSCSPFDDLDVWKAQVDNGSARGRERLDILMRSLLLRRTKDQLDSTGKPLVSLPSRTYKTHRLKLSKNEQEVYDVLFAQPRNPFKLRLRQCCCHLSLLKKTLVTSELSRFSSQLFEDTRKSTKIDAIISELKAVRQKSDDQKSVIVSQWTSMLDIVAVHLDLMGLGYDRIDGDVSAKRCMDLAEEFNTNPKGPQVMLLSLRAEGDGLSLIGGNHLFLIDMHWNPFWEDQACDRIHRVGQKKDVTIHRFVCAGTVEEKISALQEKKRLLAHNVLSGTGGTVSTLSRAEL